MQSNKSNIKLEKLNKMITETKSILINWQIKMN